MASSVAWLPQSLKSCLIHDIHANSPMLRPFLILSVGFFSCSCHAFNPHSCKRECLRQIPRTSLDFTPHFSHVSRPLSCWPNSQKDILVLERRSRWQTYLGPKGFKPRSLRPVGKEGFVASLALDVGIGGILSGTGRCQSCPEASS